jgi:hypothetical protein
LEHGVLLVLLKHQRKPIGLGGLDIDQALRRLIEVALVV